MNHNNDPQDFHNDDPEAFLNWPGETTPPRPSAVGVLAEAALDAVLTEDARALLNTRGYTLVLPGDDWIRAIKAAVSGLCPDALKITGRERYNSSSDDEVCAAIALGREPLASHRIPISFLAR